MMGRVLFNLYGTCTSHDEQEKEGRGDIMAKNKGWTKVLTFFAFIVLGYHIVHLILLWPSIPGRIAIHFTNGEPDNWGSKYVLLIMPVIGLVSWWLVGKLTKHPKKFNYINLTEKNRDKQYKMSRKIFTIHQNLILFIFIFGNESFFRKAVGGDNDDMFFTLSIGSVILMLLVIFYHVIWAARLKD